MLPEHWKEKLRKFRKSKVHYLICNITILINITIEHITYTHLKVILRYTFITLNKYLEIFDN